MNITQKPFNLHHTLKLISEERKQRRTKPSNGFIREMIAATLVFVLWVTACLSILYFTMPYSFSVLYGV